MNAGGVWLVVIVVLPQWEPATAPSHKSTRLLGVAILQKAWHLEKIRALEAGTLMEAMNMLAWDAPIWAFRPFLVGWGR